jgi:toxin ParE1/3/4
VSRFTISPPALLDLQDIDDYVSPNNPDAADRLLDSFWATFDVLATTPAAGRLRPELGSDVRAFPVGVYVVFYRPTEYSVEILRVIHGYRDIDAAFRE